MPVEIAANLSYPEARLACTEMEVFDPEKMEVMVEGGAVQEEVLLFPFEAPPRCFRCFTSKRCGDVSMDTSIMSNPTIIQPKILGVFKSLYTSLGEVCRLLFS